MNLDTVAVARGILMKVSLRDQKNVCFAFAIFFSGNRRMLLVWKECREKLTCCSPRTCNRVCV